MKHGSLKAMGLSLLCAGFLLLPTGAVSQWAFREAALSGLALGLLLLAAFGSLRSSKNVPSIPRAYLPWGVLVLWLCVTGILLAVHPGEFRLEMRRLWVLVLAGMAMALCRGSGATGIRAGLLASSGALALWVLVQKNMGIMRPTGSQANPNIVASLLVAAGLFLLPVALRDLSGSKRSRGLAALSLVFLFLCSAGLTGSRAAVLSFLLAFSCSLVLLGPTLFREGTGQKSRWFLGERRSPRAFVFICVVVLAVAAQYPALQRLISGAPGDHLSMARFFIYGSALRMIADQPIWGLGWGMFGAFYDSYKDPALWPYTTRYPHSSWLHAGVEGGIPALTLLGLGWWWVLRDLLGRARKQPWAAGAFMGVLFLLIHGLVEENLYLSAPAFFALALSTEGQRGVRFSRQNLYAFCLLGLVVFASALRARHGLSWLAHGQQEISMGRPRPALAQFRKARTALPGHASPLLGMAQAHGVLGNRALAAEYFLLALGKAGRNIDVHFSAARFHLAVGSVGEAERLSKAATALDPKNPMTQIRAAELFIEAHRGGRAVPYLEEAKRLVPEWEIPRALLRAEREER